MGQKKNNNNINWYKFIKEKYILYLPWIIADYNINDNKRNAYWKNYK